MKTIQTKYRGPTSTQGARIVATDCGDHTLRYSYPYECSGEDAHWKAANALAVKLGWTGKMHGGATKEGYVFVFVYPDSERTIGESKARGAEVGACSDRRPCDGIDACDRHAAQEARAEA